MLLALDSSTSYAGIALHDGDRIVFEETWLAGRQHTQQLSLRLWTRPGYP